MQHSRADGIIRRQRKKSYNKRNLRARWTEASSNKESRQKKQEELSEENRKGERTEEAEKEVAKEDKKRKRRGGVRTEVSSREKKTGEKMEAKHCEEKEAIARWWKGLKEQNNRVQREPGREQRR